MDALFQSIKNSAYPYVIAEIGVNHYDIARQKDLTPLAAAQLMIDAAAVAGADAVKFQSYKADTIATQTSPAYWDQTEEPASSQYELFSRYDSFGQEEYRALAEHSIKAGTTFLSTPFDFASVDYLDQLCSIFKVSSSDITNWPFLEYIARKNKPVFLSTGASNVDEIQDAVAILEKHGNGEICVLHCILSYPTAYGDAHLGMIKHLGSLFPHHMLGYSDHTRPDPTMTVLRIAHDEGAHVIEKHFTLDKTLKGNDHYHAMDPRDLTAFVQGIKTGMPDLNAAIAAQVPGESTKRFVAAEESARENARRSIVAARDIKRGDVVTRDMLTFKRPGTGIAPSNLAAVVGARAARNITADTIVTREMLE